MRHFQSILNRPLHGELDPELLHLEQTLNQELKRRQGMSMSYGRDSVDFESVPAVRERLEKLACNQRDSSTLGKIVGLRYYLNDLPQGALAETKVVKPLMQALVENENS